MKSRVKTELGYAVPEMFADEDMALSYLEDCGIAKPKKSIGKLYYFLNHLRVEEMIKMMAGLKPKLVSWKHFSVTKNIFMQSPINF